MSEEEMTLNEGWIKLHQRPVENKELIQLRAEVDRERLKRVDLAQKLRIAVIDANQLRADMTKIRGLVENILVNHVEGREFMTSSQLYEAVIQDCTAALNVGR